MLACMEGMKEFNRPCKLSSNIFAKLIHLFVSSLSHGLSPIGSPFGVFQLGHRKYIYILKDRASLHLRKKVNQTKQLAVFICRVVLIFPFCEGCNLLCFKVHSDFYLGFNCTHVVAKS